MKQHALVLEDIRKIQSQRIHGKMVYLATCTIKMNHPCRYIYHFFPMDPMGMIFTIVPFCQHFLSIKWFGVLSTVVNGYLVGGFNPSEKY